MSTKKETINEKPSKKYSEILKEKKILLLVEKDRNLLQGLIDDIIGNIYKKNNKKLYIMELNFENSVKLGDLKKNVKDFLGSRSIFIQYPKLLLVQNLDLANNNITDVYSKLVSFNHSVLCLASCTSISTIPKSVLINSEIIWNKKEEKDMKEIEFYEWLNNISYTLKDQQKAVDFLNTKLFDYEEYKKDIEIFNSMIESKMTTFKDEVSKLIL